MAILKHYAKYGSRPCIIVYREVPGLEDYCLIVDVSTLDGPKQDAFLNAINSPEGQAASELNEVLARAHFPDGTSILHDLHYTKKLQKVAVDMVQVTPNNSQSMPLRELNTALKQLKAGNPPRNNDPIYPSPEGTAGKQQTTKAADYADIAPATGSMLETDPQLNDARVNENQGVSSEPATDADVAKNLLHQASMMLDDASMMKNEATAKLEQAYKLDPNLRPIVEKLQSSPEAETSN